MNRFDIKPEKFVKVWQSSTSAVEVSEKLGITCGNARSWALFYRKHGVELVKFPRGARRGSGPNNYKELAKLAKEFSPK